VSSQLLQVRDLRVYYGAARALDGVSFEVDEGEVVTIIGGNGAGKSTTLKTISGVSELLKTVEGEITFLGQRVEHRQAHRLARMGMAHVPEGRRVFPQSSVEDNLLLGGYCRRKQRKAFAADLEDVYRRFPVLGERRTQAAGLLSGGEQQMLAIGRALMARPRFLLLDEPSLGLAPILVTEVFRIIRGLADEGTTILLVEQMANQALAVADRAYVLETGTITTEGPAATVRDDPRVQAAYLGA
jgi:branched-chain amino acid transport system ATP-binding protein